jgi:hypothetical protein
MKYIGDVLKPFDVIDDGKRAKWNDPDPTSLLQLPRIAMHLVHTYASTSNTGVVIDLDSKTVSGLETGLRGVNRCLHKGSDWVTNWQHKDFTFNMTTQKSTTSFNGFGALEELDTFALSSKPTKRTRSGRTLPSSTEMVLKFELSELTAFDNLRININSLLSMVLLQDFEGDLVISFPGLALQLPALDAIERVFVDNLESAKIHTLA